MHSPLFITLESKQASQTNVSEHCIQLFPQGVQELFELVLTEPKGHEVEMRHWLSIRIYGEMHDKQSYIDPLLQVLHGDTQDKQLLF